METGKTNKLHTRSQRVTTTLTRSVSCHDSFTSLTTISRSLARFATHSKNRTKFTWRIYSRYLSSGKFPSSFVSWDLENKMISRWSISNPTMFFIISKRVTKGFYVTRDGPKICRVTRLNPNYPRDAGPDIKTWCVIFYFTSAWRVIYKTD